MQDYNNQGAGSNVPGGCAETVTMSLDRYEKLKEEARASRETLDKLLTIRTYAWNKLVEVAVDSNALYNWALENVPDSMIPEGQERMPLEALYSPSLYVTRVIKDTEPKAEGGDSDE